MKTCIIIPARLSSIRLPNKPLADIGGKSMIVRVWEQAIKANVGDVIVACGDREIYKEIKKINGTAFMTKKSHPSGSDRVYEALEQFDPYRDYDVVINMQGDLPLIDPDVFEKLLIPLRLNADVDISTLATIIKDDKELHNTSVVKIALSLGADEKIGRALYFTRLQTPFGSGPFYHHQGVYAYRSEALKTFVHLPRGNLEKQEDLEQLRALENGMRIDAVLVKNEFISVDTPEDLEKARKLIK